MELGQSTGSAYDPCRLKSTVPDSQAPGMLKFPIDNGQAPCDTLSIGTKRSTASGGPATVISLSYPMSTSGLRLPHAVAISIDT